MDRIITNPFGVLEKRIVPFDFAASLTVGETIVSATAISGVYWGNPSSLDIINGLPTIQGSTVFVTLGGDLKVGSIGTIYDVLVQATFSSGQIIPMATYVAFVPDLI